MKMNVILKINQVYRYSLHLHGDELSKVDGMSWVFTIKKICNPLFEIKSFSTQVKIICFAYSRIIVGLKLMVPKQFTLNTTTLTHDVYNPYRWNEMITIPYMKKTCKNNEVKNKLQSIMSTKWT